MTIIPQPEDPCKVESWAKHKLQSELVSKHMRHDYRDDIRNRGALMAQCGEKLFFEKQGDKYRFKEAWLCRDRLCPICSWRLSLQRIADMQRTLVELEKLAPDSKAVHVVLTVRNCSLQQLRDVLKQLSQGFTRMKKRKLFTDYIVGYCRSIEITKSRKDGSYHPHIHCICIVPAWYTKQISYGDWVEMWRESCNLSYQPIVWAEHAYTPAPTAKYTEEYLDTYTSEAAKEAIIEAIKYTLKPDSLVETAQAGDVGDLAHAIKGLRMVSYGGLLKTARAAVGAADDEKDTEQLPALELNLDDESFNDRYIVCYRWASDTRSYVRET